MGLIEVGKSAPRFTLRDQDDQKRALKDYAGRMVVLYFYPKDDTSGCTAQTCAFRDALGEFDEAGVDVLGISILGTKSKAKFASKHDVSFPLLADDAEGEDGKPSPVVCQMYGVWVEKSMYGKTYMGIQRTTYLIGGDGKVLRRWDKVKVPGHVDAVMEAVRELGG